MATVTTLAGGTIPGINGGETWGLVDLGSVVGTINIATATVFAWTSTDGHTVTLIGNFTYGNGTAEPPTSGAVDEARLDGNTDGSIDMTIDFGAAPLAVDPDMFATGTFAMMDPYLSGADNLTIASTHITGIAFCADAHGSAASDDLTITGAGNFAGDIYSANPSSIATSTPSAVDTITVNSVHDVTVSGDLWSLGGWTGAVSAMTFLGDTITDLSAAGTNVITLVGDCVDSYSNTNNIIVELGDDTIAGGASDNVIYGDMFELATSTSNNQVFGGSDYITGGGGNDTIVGDIRNLIGSNTLVGGDDELRGGSGDDIIYGDYMTVSATSAVISGGNDFVVGGAGNDMLYGQEGDDTLGGGADDDLIDGGVGNDTATYITANSSVIVDLGLQGAAQNTFSAGLDTLIGIENLIGSDYGDTLDGDSNDNVIEGGGGNDLISGGGGSDTASYASAQSGVTVSLLLQGVSQNTVGADSDTLDGFENLLGSGFDDTLTGDAGENTINGNGGGDFIYGGDGSDTLYGGDGDDYLNGGNQNDILNGGAGDDTLDGGMGVDNLDGGAGNDLLLGGNRDDTLNGGTGEDRCFAGNGYDNVSGGDDNDILRGGDQDDILDGGAGDDELRGGDHDDILDGGAGDDDLFGGTGIDILIGGAGNDYIDALGGFDRLEGGEGNDTLIGGFNADTFVFADGFDLDTIVDFEATNNAEKIDLSAVTSIIDFTDLMSNHATQSGADVIIDAGNGDVLTLSNVLLTDLDAVDFVF